MAAVPIDNDILYSICTFLYRRSHILAFMLTCRAFYNSGLPHLLNIPSDFKIDLDLESTTTSSFFQTLLRSPQTRCKYVQVLNLHFSSHSYEEGTVQMYQHQSKTQLHNIQLLCKVFEYMDRLRSLILHFPILLLLPTTNAAVSESYPQLPIHQVIQSLSHLVNLRKLELVLVRGNLVQGEAIGDGGQTLVDDIEESLRFISLSHIGISITEDSTIRREYYPGLHTWALSLLHNRQSTLHSLSLQLLDYDHVDILLQDNNVMRFTSLHTLSIQIALLYINPLVFLKSFVNIHTLKIFDISKWPLRSSSRRGGQFEQPQLLTKEVRQTNLDLTNTWIRTAAAQLQTWNHHHHHHHTGPLEFIEITYAMVYVLGPTLALMAHQHQNQQYYGVKKLIIILCHYINSASFLQTTYDDLKPQSLGWRFDLTDDIMKVIKGLSGNVQMSERLQRLYIDIHLSLGRSHYERLSRDPINTYEYEYETRVLEPLSRLCEILHLMENLKMIIICRHSSSSHTGNLNEASISTAHHLEPFMQHSASNFIKQEYTQLETPSHTSDSQTKDSKEKEENHWSMIMQHYLKSLPNLRYLILQTRDTKFVENRVTMMMISKSTNTTTNTTTTTSESESEFGVEETSTGISPRKQIQIQIQVIDQPHWIDPTTDCFCDNIDIDSDSEFEGGF